jgi:asparagine synthase (glutamine-hydrolysing)
MCGIAGVAGGSPDDLRAIRDMTAALRHRGPDDEGYLLADSRRRDACPFAGPDTRRDLGLAALPDAFDARFDLALGHRRLSIIDLGGGGHGPMASPDGRHWIVYNGEIYNYVELREELRGRGHAFRTASDTEVLLAAYAEWGEDLLPHLNGMWAFGLYDAARSTLFCARDRFGVKPFHYFWDGEVFAFASEIKGLLAHPRAPRCPDEHTVLDFLIAGAVEEGERTFFQGIRRLPGGQCLTLDLGRRTLSVRRWYALPDPEPRPAAEGEVGDLLRDAVRLRLRSDVDVGTCLSGGLDSSSLVALTARLRDGGGGGRLSFSVLYPDAGIDESAFVSAVVEATDVDSRRVMPTAAELLHDLPALVHHQEEPFPSLAPYSQWRVMQLARDAGVKVLLDGQGADEVFAGYHYQLGPWLAEISRAEGPLSALRAARAAAAATGRSLGFLLGLLAYHRLPVPSGLRERARARAATHGRLPPGLLDPDWRRRVGPARSARHAPRSSLKDERRAAILETSLPALLRYEDRNSMAFSVEARTPYLDYRLVERAQALPASDLIRDGWTKAILREAMAGVVPDPVRWRRDKLGFATPERRWLREIAPQVREWLGTGSRLRGGRLEADGLAAWLAAPDDELARRPGLWRLVSAELWLRHVESARAG